LELPDNANYELDWIGKETVHVFPIAVQECTEDRNNEASVRIAGFRVWELPGDNRTEIPQNQ
jgi:hypothetical protein